MLLSDSSSRKKCPCSVFLRRVLFLFASSREINWRFKLGLVSNPSINFIISCFQTHAPVILTRLCSRQKIHTSSSLTLLTSVPVLLIFLSQSEWVFCLNIRQEGQEESLRIEQFWQQQWLTPAHRFEKPRVSFMTIKSTNNWWPVLDSWNPSANKFYLWARGWCWEWVDKTFLLRLKLQIQKM